MVSFMIRIFCALFLLSSGLLSAQDAQLRKELETTYQSWRKSIQLKDPIAWRKVTAQHRQISVKNRLLSERKKFPQAVFDLPAMPPGLGGLKHLGTVRRGPTAKSYYFGRVDFGLGGNPDKNLLALSFVGGQNAWKYDQMEYVNLAAMPEVREQLDAGNLEYIKTNPDLQPTGQVPVTPVEVKEAPYIAKVYVFCPGREVQVQVNQTSRHSFSNAQEAQLIIGGAQNGQNQIQYAIKDLEEGLKDAMTVRVYLMSEVYGVKPIKIYEYLVKEGEKPVGFGKGTFMVDGSIRARLMGKN